MAKPLPSPSPERFPVLSFAGAGADLIFWEKVDLKVQRVRDMVIGDPHWDLVRYPAHQLVYKVPLDAAGQWHKFFYAAERENQDDYNWQLSGEELIRTYLVLRSKYRQKAAAFTPLLEDEFTYPVVGTADATFASYGFAEDLVQSAPEELDFLYILIKRRLIEPSVVEYRYDGALGKMVSITKEIIPAGGAAPAAPAAGVLVEVQHGNVFHDVRITQQALLEGATYPYELPALPGVYDNRNFPSRLDSINLVWAWAWANNSNHAYAYADDYYYKFKIIEPRPGPYEATIRRFITDDPDALRVSYPVDIVPTPVTESIAVVSSWSHASDKGNSAAASAKEWSIPSTIHGEVTIDLNESTDPGMVDPVPATPTRVESLDATPGVADFDALIAGGTMTVDFDVKDAPFGLFEVSVIQIDISNLYTT